MKLKCPKCGNMEKFTVDQTCYREIVVDSEGEFISAMAIYDAETTYPPYKCANCGEEAIDDEYWGDDDQDRDNYVKNITVNEVIVRLYLDDYGQSYYIKYRDPNTGWFEDVSLGTYNSSYMEEIYSLLDPLYSDLVVKELDKSISDVERDKLDKYREIFDKEYKNVPS